MLYESKNRSSQIMFKSKILHKLNRKTLFRLKTCMHSSCRQQIIPCEIALRCFIRISDYLIHKAELKVVTAQCIQNEQKYHDSR